MVCVYLALGMVAQMVKNLLSMWETLVWPLGQEDPLEREWQPTPVSSPGKIHGQRSLVGYSPWGCKELDTTEQITFLLYLFREKATAPHSSTLAWKIPWTEEPGRLQSVGSLRVWHNWATSLSLFSFMHWRRRWQPTPVFCLENPRDGGAWWAAVYGVAQSWTWLKQLSSSSTLLVFWAPFSTSPLNVGVSHSPLLF